MDLLCSTHWLHIREQGLVLGAFHFYRPGQTGWQQANNFMRIVDLPTGDLPPVLDVGTAGGQSAAKLRDGIRSWLKLIEDRYGLYTNFNFYQRYLAGHLHGYPLWIAHYQVPRLRINASASENVRFWQLTDGGKIAGIKGRVDCNVFLLARMI